jgi:hypothetical protein
MERGRKGRGRETGEGEEGEKKMGIREWKARLGREEGERVKVFLTLGEVCIS